MNDRYITKIEAEEIAREAAERGSETALKRTFALLGVDLDEMESVEAFRGDLQWARSGRHLSKAIGSKAGSSIIGVIFIAIGVGVVDWAKGLLQAAHFIR